jgi:hypothetical protein
LVVLALMSCSSESSEAEDSPAAAESSAKGGESDSASLKLVDEQASGVFMALTGKKNKPLNLMDFMDMRENYCWAKKSPSFSGVRASVDFSGLPKGTELVAKLSGSSKTFEDDDGYIECDLSALKPLAELKTGANNSKGKQSIDVTLTSSATAWPCSLQLEVLAVHEGKVLADTGKQSMGVTCPE